MEILSETNFVHFSRLLRTFVMVPNRHCHSESALKMGTLNSKVKEPLQRCVMLR